MILEAKHNSRKRRKGNRTSMCSVYHMLLTVPSLSTHLFKVSTQPNYYYDGTKWCWLIPVHVRLQQGPTDQASRSEGDQDREE